MIKWTIELSNRCLLEIKLESAHACEWDAHTVEPRLHNNAFKGNPHLEAKISESQNCLNYAMLEYLLLTAFALTVTNFWGAFIEFPFKKKKENYFIWFQNEVVKKY